MACCDAGLMDFFNLDWGDQGEHKDPWAPRRKIDRVGISRESSIARTKSVWSKYKGGIEDWFDMATKQDLKELLDEQYRLLARGEINGKVSPAHAMNSLSAVRARLDTISGQLSALDALRLAVAAVKADTSVLGDDEGEILSALAATEARLIAVLPPGS